MQKSQLLLVFGAVIFCTFVQQGTSQSCPTPDGYFPHSTQCDAYIECKDGVAEQKLCPDGLYFNDQLTGYPRYPCSYPQQVQCGSRTRTQPPQATGECPHQYGMFKSQGRPDNCGEFVNCAGGVAHVQQCPEGLAFNAATVQCDWPDQVPDCDTSQFVRFSCPGVRVEADLGHPRYSDPDGDCRKFYVCVENTKPRALSCNVGTVFNPDLGVCDEPQNVPHCANYYPKDILDAFEKLRNFDNSLL